jgi:predicted AAA+ superfamily ATPase
MAAELGNAFNLAKALDKGLLPHVYMSQNPQDVLRAYIGLYLKEEVQTEGLVRNIGHFARFVEAASFSQGSVLNQSNIARECGVSRKLVEGYLSILEDLLLAFLVPVFTRRAKRQTVAHPKFYYFDVGVYKQLRAMGPLDQPSEINGPALETIVAQHLRAWSEYQNADYTLYYWRTRHGVEVDFILYGPKGFWAIEIKNSQRVHSQDLKGLEAFCADYPEAIPLLLYCGKERLKIRNILCCSLEDFLKNLTPEKEIILKTAGQSHLNFP